MSSESKAGRGHCQVVWEVGTHPNACGSHFLLFPKKASSATKGEFVLLTETDQMKDTEMFGAVQT